MILLIDNYDSFTYNLLQLAAGINPDVRIVRNDALAVQEIQKMRPSHIILSPGPGYPQNAGVCEKVVQRLAGQIPILGVCLGHQAICEAFGASIVHAVRLMHGKKSCIQINSKDPIFNGLPGNIDAARYHSLIAKRDTIPDDLAVIAFDDIGEVMAVKHKRFAVYGLQFHPESVLTPQGDVIMRNFLSLEEVKYDTGSNQKCD